MTDQPLDCTSSQYYPVARAMVTAVVESPSRQRHRLPGDDGDFELRHWRPAAKKRVSGTGMRGRRWAPPEIEIPNKGRGIGNGGGYTSLRDIMSSPDYAATTKAGSGGSPAADGDAHLIRHPLVKHAAYAYLQLTPSALEDARRRRLRRMNRGGPLRRVLLGCLGFVGALFGR